MLYNKRDMKLECDISEFRQCQEIGTPTLQPLPRGRGMATKQVKS